MPSPLEIPSTEGAPAPEEPAKGQDRASATAGRTSLRPASPEVKPRAAPAPKGSGTAAGAADPEGGVVPLGDDVTPSRRVSGVPASYPDVARRLRLAGTVTVSMVISGDGEPLEVRVVESGGDILDQAVLDAVATWRFDPARRDGKAVRVRWTVRQTFRFSR